LAFLPSPKAEAGLSDDSAHWNSVLPDPAQLLDPARTTLWLALALIWLLTALLNELMELKESNWQGDQTNFVEAPMLLIATIAVSSRLGLGHAVGEILGLSRLAPGTDIPHWEEQLISISIVGIVMINGLRAMCAFRSLGPLVMMTLRMVVDVAQWMIVPVIVTIAFILGFYSLYKGTHVGDSDDDCDIYKSELGGAPLTIGVKLFAPILGSDSMHECVMDPDATWPAVNIASPFLMVM
jgi:hypothetical protein